MEDAIKSLLKGLFDVGYSIWNAFIGVACKMFAASYHDSQTQELFNTAHTIFTVINRCTIPLAGLFFIIAIYKTVSSTPPEQQARKFMLDVLKYAIIIIISYKLWDILGQVMDFTAGLTSAINDQAGSSEINTDNNAVVSAINELPLHFENHGLRIDKYIGDALVIVLDILIYFIGGLASIIILCATGLTVIGVAFERILKPLVILPFSAIVLGIGSCSGEGERMIWQYGKALLGMLLSGAFMIIALKLGNTLFANYNLASYLGDVGENSIVKGIVLVVSVDMEAIIITGLLKSMDSLVAKVFG